MATNNCKKNHFKTAQKSLLIFLYLYPCIYDKIHFIQPKTTIMNRFILFVFSLFLSFSIAIAQDGINYQGAATDANGDELTNQNITIRASVLSGTANGSLEWEETHSTTTDQYGLFNVVIGQGTSTTNGATSNFDDMDWGSGDHFLKIEMDATGGTNYALIGTTQMMSVPYALYAKNAGIDYDSISNLLSNDSTFITNVGGGMGGSGCDIIYPDGFEMITAITWDYCASSYIVPTDKRLYINSGSTSIYINGFPLPPVGGQHIICGPGDSISSPSLIDSNIFHGFLVNCNTSITAITSTYGPSTTYTVPSNKKLVIMTTNYYQLNINGLPVDNYDGNPIVCNSGDIISDPPSTWSNPFIFNGYLVDENYFAGCGGGGSSSSNSASSGANLSIGVGSITDLNDFDQDLDLFNTQIIGEASINEDKMQIHIDQDNNVYIIGEYNSHNSLPVTIAGNPLPNGSTYVQNIFIVKYDSIGNFINFISDVVPNPTGDEYNLYSSTVDEYGNIFVTGSVKHPDRIYIRRYNSSSLSLTSEITSTGGGADDRGMDILSDNNGGAYVCGQYNNQVSIDGFTLPADVGNNMQGFVLHIDENDNVSWVQSIGDLSTNGADDRALSLALNMNGVLVAGEIQDPAQPNSRIYQRYIKQYNSAGILTTTLETNWTSNNLDWLNGIRINTNLNGDIYMFTGLQKNGNENLTFNGITLNPTVTRSHILYKLDASFNNLDDYSEPRFTGGKGGMNILGFLSLEEVTEIRKLLSGRNWSVASDEPLDGGVRDAIKHFLAMLKAAERIDSGIMHREHL